MMQYKIKLENDLVYDNIEADYADDALNIWLNNHKEYWLKNILSAENYKQLQKNEAKKCYDAFIDNHNARIAKALLLFR